MLGKSLQVRFAGGGEEEEGTGTERRFPAGIPPVQFKLKIRSMGGGAVGGIPSVHEV